MLLLVVCDLFQPFLFIYLEKHIKSGWLLTRKKSRKLRHFFIWKRLGRSLNHYRSCEGLAGELRGKENVSWNFTLSSCAGEFFSIQWNQRENIYIWQNIIWPQSTSPFSILLKPLISLSAPDRRWFTTVWQWLLFNLTEEHMPLSIKICTKMQSINKTFQKFDFPFLWHWIRTRIKYIDRMKTTK